MEKVNKINEIKIPKGVESISVTQYYDKIVIEFIPEDAKFKRGDILKSTITPELTVIFDKMTSTSAFDSIYNNEEASNHYWYLESFRHATKEEEQEFFDELKADGKRWNAEKLIVEDIPQPVEDIPQPIEDIQQTVEELKNGDLAIFWDDAASYAIIRIYGRKYNEYHYDSSDGIWNNAIKFESKEQFEKILRGEI